MRRCGFGCGTRGPHNCERSAEMNRKAVMAKQDGIAAGICGLCCRRHAGLACPKAIEVRAQNRTGVMTIGPKKPAIKIGIGSSYWAGKSAGESAEPSCYSCGDRFYFEPRTPIAPSYRRIREVLCLRCSDGVQPCA